MLLCLHLTFAIVVCHMSASTSASAGPRPTQPVHDGLVVIGAGFGRTGTSSLQEALEILGLGPCYHMREVYKDPNGVDKWDKVGLVIRENKSAVVDWESIFFGYKSAVDLPASTHYKELMEYYPEAKVILTVRDEEKWYKSMMDTIVPPTPLWSFIYKITLLRSHQNSRMLENNVWIPFCGGSANARKKEIAIAAFQLWNEKVKSTVPKDKLLVMDVTEGWEPLCKFVDCSVPNQPFPHAWNSEQFKTMIATRKRKAIRRLTAGVVVVMGLSAFGLLWRRRK